MNLNSQLHLARLKRAKAARYNPLPSVSDPTQITRRLDAFEVGHLKDAVNIWDSLEQRDDLIRTVVSKRKKSIGRQGWTVLIHDDVTPTQRAEAEQHAAALEYFYQNLRCENALDRAERGGFKLLCRQMMDAIGKRFAVHEIVWRMGSAGVPPAEFGVPPNSSLNNSSRNAPDLICQMKNARCSMLNEKNIASASTEPNLLTATFRFVPLSFFENTTGDLRYLESETAIEGTPLAPGAWMITVGEGLMFATATAWILKNLTLNDWLLYSERNGRPGLRGITSATPDSDEWKAIESALNEILNGSTVVHSTTDDVKVIDLAAGNHIPFPELVDRIDRHIAALWRGADLSTISRDRGYGASLQEKETAALEEDDAAILTETLNEYVDQWVIRYLFGNETQTLANVKVLVTPEENTTADLQIDDFLYRTGAPLSLVETLNRYGRSLPRPGEPTLQLPPTHNHTLTPTLQGGRTGVPRESFSSPLLRDLRVRYESPSYRGSAHPAVAHVPNPEDAHDCDAGSINTGIHAGERAVPSRDSSHPPIVAASCESAALITTQPTPNHKTEIRTQSAVENSPSSLSSLASVENSPSASSASSVVNDFSPQPSSFSLLQGDYLQLSPYGDFPHPRGLQRVDPEAADLMVKRFNSFRGKLGRLFGGAPFYIGHPDTPHASDLADKKAYGWVMELEAREDGIYGRVKWSQAGLDLLKNAHFKYLSPYWEAQQISSDTGRPLFRPTNLISVGLTNQPNLPVKPLANSETKSLSETLPNPLECAGTTALSPEQARLLSTEPLLVAPKQGEGGSAVKLCAQNSHPFDRRTSHVALNHLHTTSITNSIAHRRRERLHFQTRREHLQNAVKSQMRLGLTYDEAWDNIRKENPSLFTND